jgi:hypothetical protein
VTPAAISVLRNPAQPSVNGVSLVCLHRPTRSRQRFRNHALKIGEQACETRVDRPTTVASEITIALDSTFIRSRERDQRQFEVQIGKLETDGGTRQVIAAVTDGDTNTAALIRQRASRIVT